MKLIWNKRKAQNIVDELEREILFKIDDSSIEDEFKKIIMLHLSALKELEWEKFDDGIYNLKAFIADISPILGGFPKSMLYGGSFINAVGQCKYCASTKNTDSEKKDVYNFYMNAIRQDMKYSLLTRVIYGLPSIKLKLNRSILPSHYYVDGEEIEFKAEAEIRQFDVSKTCFISLPDLPHRLLSLLDVNGDVDVFTDNLAYCTEIDMGFICRDGNHRIAAKNLVGGYVESTVYNTATLFEHVTTDGLIWTDSKSGEKLEDVLDFRVAVLYELSKELYQL